MHYTLLPDKEHVAIHLEYRTRAAIVFCFVMAVAGLIGVGTLLPAYISSTVTEKDQQKTLSSIDTANDGAIVAMKSELVSDAALVASVNQYIAGPEFSNILNDLIAVRGPVKFSSLVLDRVGTSTITVMIQGIAPTRDALIALRGRLQTVKAGNIVDLPISELTKSTSVQFSLKVTEQIP